MKNNKVLMVYPNLSMLLAPPLSYAIFTALLRREGHEVDIFDVTPYVGEGASAEVADTSVGDGMKTYRKRKEEIGDKGDNFQINSTEMLKGEIMQFRPFSYEKDLDIHPKTGLFADFVQKVDEFDPDLMLFSMTEDTFAQAIKLLALVAEREIPTLCGGVFITAAPDLALTFAEVNMIGIGEGERIVVDVADRVRQGKPCHDVPGVWYKHEDGTISKNERPPLWDFTSITPDYSLFEEARFYRPMGGKFFKSVPLEAYRGCPYTCAYCNSPMQNSLAESAGLGSFIRRKPIDKLRDHIAAVVEQVKPTFFMFTDDSFMARPQQELKDFCEMYEEFRIPFWFNTRPENATPENLAMLKEVNCYRIAFGVECGNEEFREKILLRRIPNEKLIRKFEIIADSGIPFSINNIIGFPTETRELIFETIELNRQIPAYDAMTVNTFVPYHGTVLRDTCVELGLIDREVILNDMVHSSLNMPQLSALEINSLLRTFPLYVFFDKTLWPDIKRAEVDDEKGRALYKEFYDKYQAEAFSTDQDEKMKSYQKVKGGIACASNDKESFVTPI